MKTKKTILAIVMIVSIIEWGLQATFYNGEIIFEHIYHFHGY